MRESGDRHRFVLTVHHIVCDGWSSSVLFTDLGLLYAGRLRRHPRPARPGRRRTAITSPSRRVATTSRLATADEDYWAAQYPDGAPVLDLPLAGPGRPRRPIAAAARSCGSTASCTPSVKEDGARAGATLFATLLAAFEVLVSAAVRPVGFRRGHPARRTAPARELRPRRPLRQHRAPASHGSTPTPRSPSTSAPSCRISLRAQEPLAGHVRQTRAPAAHPAGPRAGRRSSRSRSRSTRSAHRSILAT